MMQIEKITANKSAFLKYNEERKKRALDILPKGYTGIFNAIHLLLHINCPDIPGYIKGENVPYGIHGIEVNASMLVQLSDLFPENNTFRGDIDKIIEKHPIELYPKMPSVESFLIMGSVGTVAQTENSDYDYWVCIDRKKINDHALQLLSQRCNNIKLWAYKRYKIEVNFFLVDIEKVQHDDFGGVGGESAGSSGGRILKEEFYRTLILLAGKIPLWWVIPPGTSDDEYARYRDIIISSGQSFNSDFIDFGNIYNISDAEFFGAALWQINKAVTHPFKSVLKMALLDMLLDKEKKYELLSDTIKRRVHDGCRQVRLIDPYAVMFDSVIDYNKKEGREDTATLLKECFYIKTGVKSNDTYITPKMNYRDKIMAEYIKEWGWNDGFTYKLKNFSKWAFQDIVKLGGDMNKFLRDTYIRLSDRLKKGGVVHKISDVDMTILGRKLFALYSKQPNKVVYIERGSDEPIYQNMLTFQPMRDKDKKPFWALYRDIHPKDIKDILSNNDLIIKSSRNLLDIVIWIVLNRLSDRNTSFCMVPNSTNIYLPEIQRLITEMQDFMPPIDLSVINNNALLQPPVKTRFFIIINFSSNLMVKDIEWISIVYHTSWGETFAEHLKGQDGVERVIEYVKNSSVCSNDMDTLCHIFIPKSHHSVAITADLTRRIKEGIRMRSLVS